MGEFLLQDKKGRILPTLGCLCCYQSFLPAFALLPTLTSWFRVLAFTKPFPGHLPLPCPLKCITHFCHFRASVTPSAWKTLSQSVTQELSCESSPKSYPASTCQCLPEQGPEPSSCDDVWLLESVFLLTPIEKECKSENQHMLLFIPLPNKARQRKELWAISESQKGTLEDTDEITACFVDQSPSNVCFQRAVVGKG